jgi:hypothetical protein
MVLGPAGPKHPYLADEKATEQTPDSCPVSGAPICFIVCTSQTPIASSHDPETISLPSDEKATELTPDLCPVSGAPICFIVCTSQTRIVSSHDPETISLPSEEKSTDLTPLPCPVSGAPICTINTSRVVEQLSSSMSDFGVFAKLGVDNLTDNCERIF